MIADIRQLRTAITLDGRQDSNELPAINARSCRRTHRACERPYVLPRWALTARPAVGGRPKIAGMTRYAGFLRGVNVGGVTMKMAHVTAALGEAGFADVRTVLASGNVVLIPNSPVRRVRAKAERVLRDLVRLRGVGIGLRAGRVRAIAAGFLRDRSRRSPFVCDLRERPGCADELAALIDDAGPDEKIARGDGVLYWQVTKSAPSIRRSEGRWARSAKRRRQPPATCARWPKCCAEH